MKWFLAVGLFLGCAELSRSSAIRCKPGDNDNSCITESADQELKLPDLVTYIEIGPETECRHGSVWDSNCHTCRCSEMGRAVCKRQEGCDKEYGEPLRCKPNTSFKRACGTCMCLENGVGLCSMKECVKISRRPITTKSKVPFGKECLPGTVWTSRCNDCKCSETGYPRCTHNDCPGQENEPELLCEPESIWNDDCNSCWCTSDGIAMCTRIGCPIKQVADWSGGSVKPKIESPMSKSSTNTTKAVICAANRMFIKDCNTCWCNEDGTSFYCTRKSCVNLFEEKSVIKNLPTQTQVCRPNSVYEMNCNTCYCNSMGTSSHCTRRGCLPEEITKSSVRRNFTETLKTPVGFNDTTITKLLSEIPIRMNDTEVPLRLKRASSQGTQKICKPGVEFRMDCNKCLCDNEGQNFSCTRNDCAALNSNGNGGDRAKREVKSLNQTDCTPGSVFEQGCNVCRCTSDGNHATCTMKMCQEESTDNDINAPESDPSFRCNPGEQFKRGCKDCTCSADGKSVFCTLRLCDQDMNPSL
ncbi:uncharacterized protein LOC119836879 isoform X2 [Zerene cesonia]|uniref:uncharacterized protein LOC119836879 isoform X2 n=1 Tax=Zerene cesonia TaxID=33412 RepID=UPI0018E54331|nr:uncharacterized protein LOC119836879 isoform X2 [Zerene cesonia]